MTQISIDEMKRDLPVHLHRVESAETPVTTKAGKPVAKIKPISANHIDSAPIKVRPFGLCAGKFVLSDDFNEPLSESILAEFEGR